MKLSVSRWTHREEASHFISWNTLWDSLCVLHTRSLNEGCVCLNAFPSAWDGSHMTVEWAWSGAWPEESSSSPASPAGAVIGSRREWRRKGKGLGKLLLFTFCCVTFALYKDSSWFCRQKETHSDKELDLVVRRYFVSGLVFQVCCVWERLRLWIVSVTRLVEKSLSLHTSFMLSQTLSLYFFPHCSVIGESLQGEFCPPPQCSQKHTPPSHFFLCFSPPLCLQLQSMHG